MENDFKVAVLVCNGIGRLVSTVARQVAYKIAKERPDDVVIIDAASLIADKKDQVEMASKYPVVSIDGCRPKCASALLTVKSLDEAGNIYIPAVMGKKKIRIFGEKRRQLTEKGMVLVDAVAEKLNSQIDNILAEEMLSTL